MYAPKIIFLLHVYDLPASERGHVSNSRSAD